MEQVAMALYFLGALNFFASRTVPGRIRGTMFLAIATSSLLASKANESETLFVSIILLTTVVMFYSISSLRVYLSGGVGSGEEGLDDFDD